MVHAEGHSDTQGWRANYGSLEDGYRVISGAFTCCVSFCGLDGCSRVALSRVLTVSTMNQAIKAYSIARPCKVTCKTGL